LEERKVVVGIMAFFCYYGLVINCRLSYLTLS
jgi:hypothetical protein